MKCFKVTGIVPFNDDKFPAATATDRSMVHETDFEEPSMRDALQMTISM